MSKVKSEDRPRYAPGAIKPVFGSPSDDQVIEAALRILDSRLRTNGDVMSSPDATRQYLRLRLQQLEHEVFAVLFLDNRHRVIDYVELFRGTIDGACVHPREVVKEALARNAAAVVFAHNHPSGDPDPSEADKRLTERLKAACGIVDIRVLDHIIIGGAESVSFAERGLI